MSDLSGSVFVLLNLPLSEHLAPSPLTLFIDSKASARNAEAITQIVQRYFGVVQVARSPILVSEDSRTQAIKIPGVLDYKVDFKHGSPPTNEVANFLYPWLADPLQGTVVEIKYISPTGAHTEYSGTNALRATFQMMIPPN